MMNWQLHLKLLLLHGKQTMARKVCHRWHHNVTTHPKSVFVLIGHCGFQPPVQRSLSRTFHPFLARQGLELLRCHHGAVLSTFFKLANVFSKQLHQGPSRNWSQALPGAGKPFLSKSKLKQRTHAFEYIHVYETYCLDKWCKHAGELWTPEYQTGAPTWCPWTVAQVNRKFRAAAAWAIREARRGLAGLCNKHASSKKISTSRNFGDNKADTFSKKTNFLGGMNHQRDGPENMVPIC